MLCGIDPILVDNEEKSFITYLLSNEYVTFGFRVTVVMGITLVTIFALFGIIRSIVSEKNNTSPVRVVGKACSTILMFFFVPACMVVFTYVTNVFVNALYSATLGGASGGIGNFLCGAFSQNALKGSTSPTFYLESGFSYMDTGSVRNYIVIEDFDYFFSWIAGVCILFALAKTLLMFVDRAISIVLLFLFAPISMSSSVIDDGAHFKLWRDQILTKYLTGYGCIIGLNIYMLIIALITNDSVQFFPNSYALNNIAKIAFILGGAASMQRVMALVGNLVSAGAGSNELRDNAIASAGFRRLAGGLGSALTSPFRGVRAASNFIRDTANRGLGNAIGTRLGFRTDRDYGIRSAAEQRNEAENKKREHEQLGAIIGSKVSEAILGNKNPGKGDVGAHDNQGDTGNTDSGKKADSQNKPSMVNNAITNSLTGTENSASNKK